MLITKKVAKIMHIVTGITFFFIHFHLPAILNFNYVL